MARRFHTHTRLLTICMGLRSLRTGSRVQRRIGCRRHHEFAWHLVLTVEPVESLVEIQTRIISIQLRVVRIARRQSGGRRGVCGSMQVLIIAVVRLVSPAIYRLSGQRRLIVYHRMLLLRLAVI